MFSTWQVIKEVDTSLISLHHLCPGGDSNPNQLFAALGVGDQANEFAGFNNERRRRRRSWRGRRGEGSSRDWDEGIEWR